MIPTSIQQIADVVHGRLHDVVNPDALVTGAHVDSRSVKDGDLFVAIVGERVDGHDYVHEAIAAGAVAVLAQRPCGVPAIVVDDPVAALGLVAADVLARLPDVTVVAITGSSGKTSTKDLIGQIAAQVGPTIVPEGSFNTEVGVPLTVLRATSETAVLILEMGMRGLGHIAYLTSIAPPDISVLLNVGHAHIELLGSREAIAQAKGEIIRGLKPGGIPIVFGDDPLVVAQAPLDSVLTFGESSTCDVRATDVRLDDSARPAFTLHHGDEAVPVQLQLHGEHFVANALAAAAVGVKLGVQLDIVADVLRAATLDSKWRMDVQQTPDGITVINDAYNANPESMRAALKALVAMAAGRRTWAVVGEMRELGDMSIEQHDAIGRLVVRLDVSRLVAVGEGARPIHLAASHEGSWGQESAWVPDVAAALDMLRSELQRDDVVLVKASRASGLDVIATELLAGGSA